jgi:hypothetical protein
MTRPAVVIWDEDNVLFQWTRQFNIFTGHDADEVWTSWSHYKMWGWTTPEFLARLEEFSDAGGYAQGEPHWDGIIALGGLNAHKRIGNVSITAKPNQRGFDDAGHWLGSFGIVIPRIMSDDKTILANAYGDSRRVFGIDDNVDHVEAMLAAGMDAYLRDQPWNRYAEHLPRVDDALDFTAIVYDYVEG